MKIRPYFLMLAGSLGGIALFVAVLAMPAVAAPTAQRPGPAPRGIVPLAGEFFVHVATTDTIAAAATYIDHPALNADPDAIFLATQNWNPFAEEIGVYNTHEIGVFYSPGEGKWAIYNEDSASMTPDAAFNVYIPLGGSNTFVHTSTDANIIINWTNLDHPDTNGDPDELVFTIHNFNPGGVGGEYHDHHLGVWYTGGARWAIFNQDTDPMVANHDFNVYIVPPMQVAVTHTATIADVTGNSTYLDHPLLNGNSRAVALVTQNWNPGAQGGIFNDEAIGVWYNTMSRRWAIFNEDESPMPTGASFNVLIAPGRTYLPAIVWE